MVSTINDLKRIGVKVPRCKVCEKEFFPTINTHDFCSIECQYKSKALDKEKKRLDQEEIKEKKIRDKILTKIENGTYKIELEYIKTKNEYKIILDKLEESKNKHEVLQKEYKIIIQKLIDIKKQL